MFVFDKDYNNLEQVAQFYPEFIAIHEELVSQKTFPSNSQFRGKIAGLAGGSEDTGIYLLQQLKTTKMREYKILELQKSGYKQITSQQGGNAKYESVVKVGNDYSMAGTNEYPKARVWFADGRMYIVPKGNRTRGYNVFPDSVVFVK